MRTNCLYFDYVCNNTLKLVHTTTEKETNSET